MNKKIIIIIIIAVVLAITAFIFRDAFRIKINQAKNAGNPKQDIWIEPLKNNGIEKSSVENDDADIQEIEADLGAISEADFEEDSLSDENIGL